MKASNGTELGIENLFNELVTQISNNVVDRLTKNTSKFDGKIDDLIKALLQPSKEEKKEPNKVVSIAKTAPVVAKTAPASTSATIVRGRKPIINQSEFISVLTIAKSPDDVISAFPALREMDPAKARTYVSMRAYHLRSKGVAITVFHRGRKKVA